MLVPAAKNPPRARELACQIERSQRDNVLRAAVEEYDYEETRRKTRSLAMEGINSDMWHSYLEDRGSSERQMRVPKPKEGHALPYCKCMVYDEVAEHYYDEDRNWAYNPRTGFWYHRDGVYYTYYEPLGVLVGYAKDSPVRALPGEAELSEEQEARIRKEISRVASGLPSQAAPSARRSAEIGDDPSEGSAGLDGRESRSKPSKVQSMSDDGKLQRGNEAGLPVVGGKKGQRTTEAERSSLGSSKLASIYFNPNQFGTMSLPRLPPQEQKTRLQPQSVALETAPAPLASEPVILSKQPLGETRKRLVSSGGDGKEGAICMLCQRRFNSVELLLRHEKLSKMHKANLEKEKKQSMESQGESDLPPWRKAVK
ncbi:hypothetical protein Pmar_PMAR000786 [Perkinsus marinus ATCC 50983]|uniref:Uncharacterized protein n=1 Tax=Perkinsus marinus (strain ATCC 50983 / TXsc) TaxID=423536 RepID=C5KXL7_PERM5|nr:hypothetical protein Pmar_PMAR000786 [Perkinsus marinus ATCC 50983]EER10741.1 hypothetical protein Pmar_PMAR000786 [Perkinsus marinus ATCC 50983]|eukprot:XP_002778946.1 hypothetical protein Pmar_PMAR000786 [Perkinsus marinus ATCC 50983]